MQLNNGQWNDEDCRKTHGFICQSEKRSDQNIQFGHKEFVAFVNDSFVDIIVDRLFVTWNEVTVKWIAINQRDDCDQEIMQCNGTITFNSGESATNLIIPISNG